MEDILFWATEMIKLRNVVFFGSAILDLCSSVPFVHCHDLFFLTFELVSENLSPFACLALHVCCWRFALAHHLKAPVVQTINEILFQKQLVVPLLD